MLTRLRPRITYANITSTVALIVALSGTAVAGTTLIDGSSLKDRSVAGKKLKNNTLGGRQINESKLSKVKRAVLADRATASSNSAKLGGFPPSAYQRPACPTGTELVDAVCIETAKRGSDTWSNADMACNDAQRRLPTVAELESLRFSNGTDFGLAGEWTSDYQVDNNGMTSTNRVRIVGTMGAGSVFFSVATGSYGFRCVAPVP